MPAEHARRRARLRDPGALLTRQMAALAGDHARVTLKRERPWASITFSGTRHYFAVEGDGAVEPAEMQRLAATLPDHEFLIPGHFVADILVTDHSDKRLLVEALSIIDPVEPPRDGR
ncbi:hypothetical protein [Sphingorhabdus sp. YGSMI21]|uniref:hypothetical protein n=1 Tax=Sphingorhabdus sp. YGSMI21 TaxID=2077182 RepID=UPI000C1EBB0B|nr:hypothetical protein [Sphingorhabdus sp. YGSMI21]ATW03574.1 hypothetical protein CHN51_08530 [Sphingorhabdus sp. YGSMI21]